MGFRCRWDCRRIPLAPLPSQLLLQRITSDYAVFSIRLSLGMVTYVRLAVGFGIIGGLQRIGCLTPSLLLVVSLLLFKRLPVGFWLQVCAFSWQVVVYEMYTNVYPTHNCLLFSFFFPYMLQRVHSIRSQLFPTKNVPVCIFLGIENFVFVCFLIAVFNFFFTKWSLLF